YHAHSGPGEAEPPPAAGAAGAGWGEGWNKPGSAAPQSVEGTTGTENKGA
ncbi:ABC transporter ATP-binding protein, partial [Streptomyces sp. SID8455]|nr:ABC transporter ATP-binding protein [Streptomyces sp. SID8455]